MATLRLLCGCVVACLLIAMLGAGVHLHAAPPAQGQLSYVLATIATLRATSPAVHERFRQNDGAWEVTTTDDYTIEFRPGVYAMRIDAAEKLVWGNSSYRGADFYAEVDAFHLAGPEDNSFGIGFRQQTNGDMYLFSASSDGFYRFLKVAQGEIVTIVPWTPSTLLETGAQRVNRIAVFAEGPEITMLLNDQVVEMLWDKSYAAGRFALSASAPGASGVEVAFDDLMIWELAPERVEAATPTPTPAAPRRPAPLTPTPTWPPKATAVTAIDALHDTLPVLSDFFTVNAGHWRLIDSLAIASAIKETLRVEISEPTQLGFLYKKGVMPADFLAEVDIWLEKATPPGRFGLAFRVEDGENYYLYLVNNLGHYGLWNYVDGDWTALIPFSNTAANVVAPGRNRLGVLAQGDQLTLTLNGVAVETVTDASHPTGDLALVAGSFDETPVVVHFDDFAYWLPAPR